MRKKAQNGNYGRYGKWRSIRRSLRGGGGERLREKLKELRRRKGWSQEDLAREVGVSLSTIQRWEARRASPTARRAGNSGGSSKRRGLTARNPRETWRNPMLGEATPSSQGRGGVTTIMARC